ncbi:MAG: prolyl-tRNA synthetase associated domain-containing protein [Ruminococcaceae bacterium]|nr:prolyl-tRNA synthetase associated domain-containing protein [Oscillospiraceae bacterium]
MVLYNGRPENTDGRLKKEIRSYDFLDSIGVKYTRVDHPAAMSMEACKAIDSELGTTICKNLFLCNRQQTEFYLLMMPAHKNFKTSIVSSQVGSSRLSFASPEFMEKFLDVTPGSVSILGLMNDKGKRVHLLIDEDVLSGEFVGCHPCINTTSLRLRTEDLRSKVIPALAHPPRFIKLP